MECCTACVWQWTETSSLQMACWQVNNRTCNVLCLSVHCIHSAMDSLHNDCMSVCKHHLYLSLYGRPIPQIKNHIEEIEECTLPTLWYIYVAQELEKEPSSSCPQWWEPLQHLPDFASPTRRPRNGLLSVSFEGLHWDLAQEGVNIHWLLSKELWRKSRCTIV